MSRRANSPLTTIANAVNHPDFDLYQPRDWPHRKKNREDEQDDDICFTLLSMPLDESSPGRRSHRCDACGQGCTCIHDNVLCWKCKGAFCAIRCFPPENFSAIPMDAIVKTGFGRCPSCQEPLRSIGLIDVYRIMMEHVSSPSSQTTALPGGAVAFHSSREYNYNNNTDDFCVTSDHSSLVQEAEEALARAYKYKSDNDKKAAILEFTHAINAINYFASSSGDLVLRPHDILLIAHAERAKLEDRNEVMEAILAAYPRASVKNPKQGEGTWFLSMSAFRSLFYPLPGCLLVGSPKSIESNVGLLRLDLRTDSRNVAFALSDTIKQLSLCGAQEFRREEIQSHPHCQETDRNFSSLNGSWKGLMSYIVPLGSIRGDGTYTRVYPTFEIGLCADDHARQQLQLINFIQFVRVFPSATAASEYTRILFETKCIGEEGPPANSKDCPRIEKQVKKLTKSLCKTAEGEESQDMQLCRVRALRGVVAGHATMLSVIAAVGNVSTKIFINYIDDYNKSYEKYACMLVARVLVYLNDKLCACRTVEQSDGRLHFQTADMTICAYCGSDSADMKRCTRCKSARYCNAECQRNHWETKGPNSHRLLCKKVSAVEL